MNFLKRITLVIGRFFLSLIFLISALKKIFSWQEMENSLVNQIVEWNSFVSSNSLKDFFTEILPWTPIFLLISMILELLGSILLFLGIKTRLGAFFLLLCLIPTTLIMHPFWYFQGTEKEIESIMFLKNLAILGGLFIVWVYGAVLKNEKTFPKKVHIEK